MENMEGNEQGLAFRLLLEEQFRCLPSPSFLAAPQCEIRAPMHQRLADWMLDMTEEWNCEREVFPSAVVYMDRFVAQHPHVPLSRFQLVGAAALHVASKVIGTVQISAEALCQSMDNSFTEAELKKQELELLTALNWVLDVPRPHDFLEHFLARVSVPVDREERGLLCRNSEVFIDLAYTDVSFLQFGPAVIAAAAIYCAAFGIEGPSGTQPVWLDVPQGHRASVLGLLRFFPTQQELVFDCIRHIKQLYGSYGLAPSTSTCQGTPVPNSSCCSASSSPGPFLSSV